MAASSSDDELYLISYFVICKDSRIINHSFQLENFDFVSPLLLNQLLSHSLVSHPEIFFFFFSNNCQATNIFHVKTKLKTGRLFSYLRGKKSPITISQKNIYIFSLKLISSKINIAPVFHPDPSPSEQRAEALFCWQLRLQEQLSSLCFRLVTLEKNQKEKKNKGWGCGWTFLDRPGALPCTESQDGQLWKFGFTRTKRSAGCNDPWGCCVIWRQEDIPASSPSMRRATPNKGRHIYEGLHPTPFPCTCPELIPRKLIKWRGPRATKEERSTLLNAFDTLPRAN